MGVHDRDYIRDRPFLSAPSFGTAASGGLLGAHPAIKIIVGINVIIYLMWLAAMRSSDGVPFMVAHFTASRDGLASGYLHELITSSFSHAFGNHLLLNVIFLWWVGRAAEEVVGSRNFFALYVICGVFGALVHVAIMPLPILGASGATMAMIVMAGLLDPHRPLSVFGMFHVSAGRVALGFVVVTVVLLLLDPNKEIGDLTHLAGALAGFLCWRFDLRPFRKSGQSPLIARLFARARDANDRGSERAGGTGSDSSSPSAPPNVDTDTAARMEKLLEKISKEGIESLTDEEREFLATASRKYR